MRDALLGTAPSDYDVTTSALPYEVCGVFAADTVIPTGIKHGTVTVLAHGEPIEVTTFRTDGSYTDRRKPDSVRFCRTLEEDLSRRDFTIGAIAYSESDGIIDPYGGRRDIEHRVIRCVDDPQARLSEDALRILRALRFSATLGFPIEPETDRALRELAPLLNRISAERCREELLRDAWGWEYLTETKTVDTHIKRLRDKISSAGYDSGLVETVRGYGYRFKK